MFIIIKTTAPTYVRVIKLTDRHKHLAERGIIEIINCSTGEIYDSNGWTLLPLEEQ